MTANLKNTCESKHVFERYIEACEKHLPNQPYPHEPLLMSEARTEEAIFEVKNMSYKIYELKMRRHKNYAKKNKMAKIHAYFEKFNKPMKINVNEINLDYLSKFQVKNHINRLEKYSDKHPEKCYLNVLKKLIKMNDFKDGLYCFNK
jgi:hypothetical protein